jgi:hypothetical protein
MTKIFIHIGMHKTGTTTIQHALREANASAGAKEGWDYIAKPLATKNLMHAQAYDENLVKEFSEDLNKKVSQSGKSLIKIISSEGLSGLPTDGYMNSGVVATMLRDATRKYDVKIIIYLRRQDDMAESMYTQKIHEGNSLEFEEFIPQLTSGLSYNYSRILQDWVSCFGKENVIVNSYHAAAQRGLLKDFGEIIGSAGILNSKPERRNPSYSYDAIKIARIANASLDESSKRRLRRALQKTMAKQKSKAHALFSEDGRKEFLDKYKDSNQEVTDMFFNVAVENVFPEPERNFSEVEGGAHKKCIAYEEVCPLVVELSKTETAVGLIAGARVAISGYPRLKMLLRKILGRG